MLTVFVAVCLGLSDPRTVIVAKNIRQSIRARNLILVLFIVDHRDLRQPCPPQICGLLWRIIYALLPGVQYLTVRGSRTGVRRCCRLCNVMKVLLWLTTKILITAFPGSAAP